MSFLSLVGRMVAAVAVAVGVSWSGHGADHTMAHARPSSLVAPRFTPLDGGRPLAPHVLVTAMAFGGRGTVYAGGRYMVADHGPGVHNPFAAAGSVWMVSHDGGVHWAIRVSTTDLRAVQRLSLQRSGTWTNHRQLPLNFTPLSIAVDPLHHGVLYVAGCLASDELCQTGVYGDHMIVTSTDGGATWSDALWYRHPHGFTIPTATTMHTNIVASASLMTLLRGDPFQIPGAAMSVAIDPRDPRTLYACVSGLGMLYSADAGKSWRYSDAPQPSRLPWPCEILIDAHNDHVVYSLDRYDGLIFRSADGGHTWRLASSFGRDRGQHLFGLTERGQALYVGGSHGIYRSTDRGETWHLLTPAPRAGELDGLLTAPRYWIGAVWPVGASSLTPGLYVGRRAGGWQLAAATTTTGPTSAGALDFYGLTAVATRMWQDPDTHIVYTTATSGGLFRWGTGP